MKKIVFGIVLVLSIVLNCFLGYKVYIIDNKDNNSSDIVSDSDKLVNNDENHDVIIEKSSDNDNNCEEYSNVPTKSYTFTNSYGDNNNSVTVDAIQADTLTGFSGASSHAYYIDDKFNLHHISLSDLSDTILSNNIVRFEVLRDGSLVAFYNGTYDKKNDDSYVIYKEN